MNFDAIRLAVETRLADWQVNGAPPTAPIAYDGVPNGPTLQDAIDNKQAWVRLTVLNGDGFTSEVGSSPRARRPGVISCQIFTPERQGSAEAYRLADSLSAQLQYWSDGDLETLAASATRVGPSDGWFQVNLSVPFTAH